jgi:hypothetical protein
MLNGEYARANRKPGSVGKKINLMFGSCRSGPLYRVYGSDRDEKWALPVVKLQGSIRCLQRVQRRAEDVSPYLQQLHNDLQAFCGTDFAARGCMRGGCTQNVNSATTQRPVLRVEQRPMGSWGLPRASLRSKGSPLYGQGGRQLSDVLSSTQPPKTRQIQIPRPHQGLGN